MNVYVEAVGRLVGTIYKWNTHEAILLTRNLLKEVLFHTKNILKTIKKCKQNFTRITWRMCVFGDGILYEIL